MSRKGQPGRTIPMRKEVKPLPGSPEITPQTILPLEFKASEIDSLMTLIVDQNIGVQAFLLLDNKIQAAKEKFFKENTPKPKQEPGSQDKPEKPGS